MEKPGIARDELIQLNERFHKITAAAVGNLSTANLHNRPSEVGSISSTKNSGDTGCPVLAF
jgi:hypothetical protein